MNLEADGSLVGSLVWQKFVPETKYIHEHGCKTAAARNGNPKIKQRQVYCGAYEVLAGSIRALPEDNLTGVSSADVKHKIENDELAHVEVKIQLLNPDLDLEGTKTAIHDRLWNSSSGPMNHICDSDQDLMLHPNQNLPAAPRGPFVDSRSWILRKWSLMRFRFYDTLWNSRFKLFMFRDQSNN